MLRIHFLPHWFNLSDPGVEEALYDSRAMRRFVGIDLGREPVPDETTVCKFRHLLESRNVGERLFALINEYLDENGLKVNTGTMNRSKSRVRAKVEHPFLVLKNIFGFKKVRYRGLHKNANRLFVACGLVNIYLARRPLLRPT